MVKIPKFSYSTSVQYFLRMTAIGELTRFFELSPFTNREMSPTDFLALPRFTGEEDSLEYYLSTLAQSIQENGCNWGEEELHRHVPLLLEGKARRIYNSRKEGDVNNWQDFLKFISDKLFTP